MSKSLHKFHKCSVIMLNPLLILLSVIKREITILYISRSILSVNFSLEFFNQENKKLFYFTKGNRNKCRYTNWENDKSRIKYFENIVSSNHKTITEITHFRLINKKIFMSPKIFKKIGCIDSYRPRKKEYSRQFNK